MIIEFEKVGEMYALKDEEGWNHEHYRIQTRMTNVMRVSLADS